MHSSVKLGVRPSFCLISSNSSAVSRNCSAVCAVISIDTKQLVRKGEGRKGKGKAITAIVVEEIMADRFFQNNNFLFYTKQSS